MKTTTAPIVHWFASLNFTALLLAAVLGSAVGAKSATYTFNKTVAGTYPWTTAANWTGGVPVDANDAAIVIWPDITTALPNNSTFVIDTDPATLTLNTLTLNGKASGTAGSSSMTAGSTANTWTFNGLTPTVNLNAVFTTSTTRILAITVNPKLQLNQNIIFTGNGTANTATGAGGFIFPSVISESGGTWSLTKSGTSLLTLSGANTYSGGTTNTAGILSLGHANALGTGRLTLNGGQLNIWADLSAGLGVTNAITLAANSTINFPGVASVNSAVFSGVIGNDGAARDLTLKTGYTTAGTKPTITLSAANTYGGNTIIAKAGAAYLTVKNGVNDALSTTGTLECSPSGQLGLYYNLNGYNQTIAGLIGSTGPIGISGTGSSVLTINTAAATDYLFSGQNHPISGTLAIVKTGAGIQRISGIAGVNSMSYSGGTKILGGTFVAGVHGIGTGPVAITNGLLQVDASLLIPSDLQGDATAAIDLNGGALTNAFDSTSSEFAGVITNTGSFTKGGSGKLTLSGANTYTGATLVSAGTLLVNSPGSLGSSTVLVSAGTLGGNGTIGGLVTLAADAILAPGNNAVGTLTFSSDLNLNTNTLVFEITNLINADKIIVGGILTPTGTNIISLPNSAALVNGDYTLFEVAGTLNGDPNNFSVTSPNPAKIYTIVYQTSPNKVALKVASSGAAILSWWGDGSGNVWDASAANWTNAIDGGALVPFANNSLATFNNLGSAHPTVNLTGTVLPSATVVDSTANYTFAGSGAIGGTNSLTKLGTSTLTISNANTFNGAVNINVGAIAAANSAAFGTADGGVNVAANATLALAGDITVGAEALSLNPETLPIPSLLNGSGTNTWNGDIAASTGTTQTRLYSAAGKLVINGNIATTGGTGSLNVGGDGDSRISGIISGVAGFYKSTTGAGTCTLSGHNTFEGPTTVGKGTLVIAGSLTNTAGAVTINNGTLTVSGAMNAGTGSWNLGNAATSTNGVLNINGGVVVADNLHVSTVTGGSGALNVNGGNLTILATAADKFRFGMAAGAYGAFTLSSGGTVSVRDFQTGAGTTGIGVGLIANGTLNVSANFLNGRTGIGVMIIEAGGVINQLSTSNNFVLGNNTGGHAEVNLVGGTIERSGTGVALSVGTNFFNLNAGLLKTDRLAQGTGVNRLNFNGGMLQVSSNSVAFNTNAAGYLPTNLPVYVNGAFGAFAGGAVIDTAGYDVTNAANMRAPTGDGVSAVSVLGTEGSGYIGAPYVQISGDGTGATAFANMVSDGAGGLKVGSVIISNPGNDYTSPTVTFLGGAPAVAATGTASLAANTSGGLTKNGLGTLHMNGANTYTNTTIINAGTLAGSGSFAGPVIIGSAATLSPGASIGTLTINSTLTNAGTILMEIDKASGTNDVITGLTTINYGGTLTVNNLGGTFVGGETYQLFSVASYTGNFSATNLPVITPLKWAWNPANGTLSVISGTDPTPTNLTASVSSGILTLTWPESHRGWTAESNSVNLANASDWHAILGSETQTNLDITLDPALTNVFYRLSLP